MDAAMVHSCVAKVTVRVRKSSGGSVASNSCPIRTPPRLGRGTTGKNRPNVWTSQLRCTNRARSQFAQLLAPALCFSRTFQQSRALAKARNDSVRSHGESPEHLAVACPQLGNVVAEGVGHPDVSSVESEAPTRSRGSSLKMGVPSGTA
jgi:hypothetical protein